MSLRPSIPLAAAACAALLLPSCVEWRIGLNIREAAETKTALNIQHPVDGRLYASRQAPPASVEKEYPCFFEWGRKGTTYYARVPVEEYSPSSTLVLWHLPHAIGGTSTTAGKPTGQFRLIAIRDEKLYVLPEDAALPQGLRRVGADGREGRSAATAPGRLYGRPRYVVLSTRRSPWSPLVTAAAAPFDYLIDPALTVVSTGVVGALGLVGVGSVKLVQAAASPFRQEAPSPPAAPAQQDATPSSEQAQP